LLFITGYLNHAASLQRAIADLGLRGHADVADFRLTVSDGSKETCWFPRFVGMLPDGRFAYSAQISELTTGFIGWLPYRGRSWRTADKRAFKTHAATHDIATPASSADATQLEGPFIVKRAMSSFGAGIRGPFARLDPNNARQRLQAGEWYEAFISGYIVKAFYWGADLTAIEFRKMPTVRGDGHATLRQLVESVRGRADARPHDWDSLTDLAHLCGLRSVDDVLAEGKEALIDFKYGSRYDRVLSKNRNTIDRVRAIPALAEQFENAGRVFAESIGTAAERDTTFYTIDAIVDGGNKAWFLEMNCNPMVHPDAYPSMLRSFYPSKRN